MGFIERFDADWQRLPRSSKAKPVHVRGGYRGLDGKRHSRTFETVTEAKAWVADQERHVARGGWIDPELARAPFGEYWEEVLSNAEARLKPKTIAGYRSIGQRWILPEFADVPLNAITTEAIRKLLERSRQGHAAATPHSIYRVLRLVFAQAVDEGIIDRNPAARLRIPEPPRRRAVLLRPEDIEAIADQLIPRERALLRLLCYGGLRIGEAVALRPEDLDLARCRVHVSRNAPENFPVGTTKTGRERTVLIPETVAADLEEHLRRWPDPDLVFTGERVGGRMLRGSVFRHHLAKAAEAAGIDPVPTPHDLRHTAVALAISAGYHPKAVQELAGHASITTTLDTYGWLFEQLQVEGVDRLNAIARAARPRALVSGT